ncbi:MAG: hypothetical protein HC819_12220 [Cyclobacteriaceae bacterium]|nr:hypothetical protein [Cyclobacteriaceae bacterium]
MNRFTHLFALVALFATLSFFSSCDTGDDGPDVPKKTGVLVINEGNFSNGDGSLSFYDEENMTIANNVVKNANGGANIGGTIQSLTLDDGVGYLLCNAPDKIEFISADDFKYLANPVTNLSQPRYMAIAGDKGYISCWGPWGPGNSLPKSYIAVMDLKSRSIVDTLACGSGPEGIVAIDNKLFVANSFETSISVIDLEHMTSKKIYLFTFPRHFAVEASGTLWATVASGLYRIDPTTLTKTDSLVVNNAQGKFAIDGDGKFLYLLTAQAWPGTKTEIYKFDIKNKTLGTSALVTGDGFYGLAFNGTTDRLYVGVSPSFSGAGKIYVYNTKGTVIDDADVGVGPNGFAFK